MNKETLDGLRDTRSCCFLFMHSKSKCLSVWSWPAMTYSHENAWATVPQCITRSSNTRADGQLGPRYGYRTCCCPSHDPIYTYCVPIAGQLILISCPTEGRRPSWPEHTQNLLKNTCNIIAWYRILVDMQNAISAHH